MMIKYAKRLVALFVVVLLSFSLVACGNNSEGGADNEASGEATTDVLAPRDDNATYPQDLNPEQYEKHLEEAFDTYVTIANENPEMSHEKRLAKLYTENPDLDERSSADILTVYYAMRLRENGYTMEDLSKDENEAIKDQLKAEVEEYYPNAMANQEQLKEMNEKMKDDPENEELGYLKTATLDNGSYYAMTYVGDIIGL